MKDITLCHLVLASMRLYKYKQSHLIVVSLALLVMFTLIEVYVQIKMSPLTWQPDKSGTLTCQFTLISWLVKQDPLPATMYAYLYGQTVNSTMCPSKTIEYYDYISNNYDSLEQFKQDVERRFPIGSKIDCSVTTDCTFFRPYNDPNALNRTDQMVIFVVLNIIFLVIIIISAVILIIQLLLRCIEYRNAKASEKSRLIFIAPPTSAASKAPPVTQVQVQVQDGSNLGHELSILNI